MQGITPLFFIGNKRSGTSLLVRLLNMHPDVFVAHESDIIWILYCFEKYGEGKYYDYDPPDGMRYTMKTCRKIIESDLPVREKFKQSLLRLMKKGSKWLPEYDKAPKVLGDKKPNQQLDTMEFTKTLFPDAKYIHCIRHPADFVESVIGCGKLECYGNSKAEILKYWIQRELESLQVDSYTVDYEQLCNDTTKTMDGVFRYVGVDIGLKFHLRKPVKYSRKVEWLTKEAVEIYEKAIH